MKTELTVGFGCLIIALLFIANILPTLCTVLDSVCVTVSISTGLYPNLDLQNANKLRYITLQFEYHDWPFNVVATTTCKQAW